MKYLIQTALKDEELLQAVGINALEGYKKMIKKIES
jgi:hypothetical protein